MTGRDQQDPPAPPSEDVSDLVNHYRAQRDAWREWESQIEKLHRQILTAAERRAATIVTTARADIRRILVEARRDLLDLTSHVREVTGGQEDRSIRSETAPAHAPETGQWSRDDAGAKKNGTPAGDIHDRLLSARHDVRRLLDEARPAIESLSEEALPPRQRPQPQPRHEEERPEPEEEQISTFVAERSIWAEASSGAEAWSPASTEDAADAHTFRRDGDGTREGRSKRILVALASVVAAAILLGLAWWLRPERVSLELPVTQATAAPATAAPVTAAPVQPAVPPAVDKAPPPPPAAAAPGSLVIIVEAHREAWIQSTIDGKADVGRLYPAGETRRIDGAGSVLLRVGDAGAVSVSVNGKDAEILGQDGRIVTRRYGADDEPFPPATPRGER